MSKSSDEPYRSSDGVRGRGAAVKYLSHSRSLQSGSANPIPLHSGTDTYANGATLNFSRPGKPIDNAYSEAFNGRFRAGGRVPERPLVPDTRTRPKR
jgi:transposase InsO family protein